MLIAKMLFLKKFFYCLFIFERNTERERLGAGEGQRETESQKLNQAPGSELSAQSRMKG